jgi:dethiobiotin synthetase
MNQRFFVTGTGTGIGKSFITAALVRQARALGRSVTAYKPVVTGWHPDKIDASDTGLLLRSMEMAANEETIQRLSPWRYEMAMAPSMAAAIELRSIDFDALALHSRGAVVAPDDVVLIEGVGGVMVPLGPNRTVLDWIDAVEIPALLVTGSYLGTLSHTFTALAVMKQRHIPLHAIIVNESEDSPLSLEETVDEIARWTSLPVVPVKRRASNDDWHDVKELRGLLA